MPAPQDVSLPPFFTLTDGMRVRVTALDPVTGNLVTGVKLSGITLSVDQEAAEPPADSPGNASGAYLAGDG